MANIQLRINSIEQLQQYKKLIKETSDKTIENMRKILDNQDSIDILYQFKFTQIGHEPIKGYDLNFIEQLNQLFSHIVCLKAAEILLPKYSDKEFILNLGTQSGYDIMSVDGEVIGECFATTTPISNNKIKSDAEKLIKDKTAREKYIIFYSKEVNDTVLNNLRIKFSDITFIRLSDVSI